VAEDASIAQEQEEEEQQEEEEPSMSTHQDTGEQHELQPLPPPGVEKKKRNVSSHRNEIQKNDKENIRIIIIFKGGSLTGLALLQTDTPDL